MTGLVLVVDDLEPNQKLLEAKLTSEYYDVVTAYNGFEAITKAKQHHPDIILLDVMMPEMDGFEACKKLKEDPETAHIPVVMVTALSEPSDRVKGLAAGADDFLTKPINETALFARVKSLLRLKMVIDELRLRDQTGAQMGVVNSASMYSLEMDLGDAKVLVIDDDVVQGKQIVEKLKAKYKAELMDVPQEAMDRAAAEDFDLIVVSTQLMDMDGLRLCSHLRSQEATRHIPLLMMIEEDDDRALVKGLEIGVNDYIITPVDYNELLVRARTQIRRKRYQEALKSNYKQSISLAITDNLTGLYNRHYLNAHLQNLMDEAKTKQRPLSCMVMDMDHFKQVNDTYGHAAGDEVLKELARRIVYCTRSSDLAVRFGGEEFVVVMPNTSIEHGVEVAERIRKAVETGPFMITHEVGQISKTISIGVSHMLAEGDTPDNLIKRADEVLYKAKSSGRNRVETAYNSPSATAPGAAANG